MIWYLVHNYLSRYAPLASISLLAFSSSIEGNKFQETRAPPYHFLKPFVNPTNITWPIPGRRRKQNQMDVLPWWIYFSIGEEVCQPCPQVLLGIDENEIMVSKLGLVFVINAYLTNRPRVAGLFLAPMLFHVAEMIGTFYPCNPVSYKRLLPINIKIGRSKVDLPELSGRVCEIVWKLPWPSLCKHVRSPNVSRIVRNSGNTARDDNSFRVASLVMVRAPQEVCCKIILDIKCKISMLGL